MYTLRFIRTFYFNIAGGTKSKVMEKTIQLPFVPYPGLIVELAADFCIKLDHLSYSMTDAIFYNEDQKETSGSEDDFETEVDHYLSHGWIC